MYTFELKDQTNKIVNIDKIDIPYACHYKPRFVYFYPTFQDNFIVFKDVFEIFALMYG